VQTVVISQRDCFAAGVLEMFAERVESGLRCLL